MSRRFLECRHVTFFVCFLAILSNSRAEDSSSIQHQNVLLPPGEEVVKSSLQGDVGENETHSAAIDKVNKEFFDETTRVWDELQALLVAKPYLSKTSQGLGDAALNHWNARDGDCKCEKGDPGDEREEDTEGFKHGPPGLPGIKGTKGLPGTLDRFP